MDAANAVLVKQKKILKKWLRHCANLEKEYPLLAAVCADYAIDELIKVAGQLESDQAEIRSGTKALLDLCEKHLGPSYKEKTRQGKEELMVLAMETFSKADALDRNGRRDTVTRTLFYNAWEFLSVVTSGMEVEESVKEKKRYAMWRAAEISNALRDNREPLPPPQSMEEDESLVRELEKHLGGFPEEELHHADDEWNGTGDARAGDNNNNYNWEQTAGGTGTGNKWEEAGAGMDEGQRRKSNGTGLVGIRDYFSGQDVIYCEDASGHQTVSAVVRAVIPAKKSGQQMYDIVTQDGRRLQVSSELLAPDVTCGEELILDGSGEAVIEEIYGSQWPPRYLVKTGNGFVQATDEDLRYRPIAGPGEIEEVHDNDNNEKECEDGTTGNNEAPLLHTADVKVEEGLPHVPGSEDEVPQRPADSDGVEDSDDFSWHRQDPWPETGHEVASAPEASDASPQGTYETEVSPAGDRFDGETCDYIDSYPLPHGIFDKSGDMGRHISSVHRELGNDEKAERNVHIQARTQTTTYSTDVKDMVDAEKCIKSASSALQFNDVGTAVKYLYEALNLLEIQK